MFASMRSYTGMLYVPLPLFRFLDRVCGRDVKFSRDLERLVRPHLVGQTQQTILDVGCGDGRHTVFFLGRGNTVHGLDIGDHRSARSVPFHFRVYDGVTFPYADETFDLVVSFDVLEHVEDDGRMVREMWRVLKPGGRVFAGTPNRTRIGNIVRTGFGLFPLRYPLFLEVHQTLGEIIHVREYTAGELRELFRGGGFDAVAVQPFWLGFRLGGLERCSLSSPGVLRRYAHYLFLTARKPSGALPP